MKYNIVETRTTFEVVQNGNLSNAFKKMVFEKSKGFNSIAIVKDYLQAFCKIDIK